METIKKYFRIERKDVCFLRYILDAYEGMAIVSTVDPKEGIIVIRIAPGCEADVDMIIKALQKEIDISPFLPSALLLSKKV